MAEIYGTAALFEDARDKLIARLNALKTIMASGYNPTFSYVYDGHVQAKLQLNAVSVALEAATREQQGAGTAPIFDYLIALSIRVHTAYVGGFNDTVKNVRLLNSIDNDLSAHLDLGGGYLIKEISDYEVGADWPDSATMGGQMTVTILRTIDHAQI